MTDMTPQEKEQYYDNHVAPKLLEVAKECDELGLSLLAVCEWAPGEYGSTVLLREGASFGLRLTHAATQANGNVDSLLIAIERHAREHGHCSAYLSMRGIPTTPEPEETLE
jgi:hypothetical protein